MYLHLPPTPSSSTSNAADKESIHNRIIKHQVRDFGAYTPRAGGSRSEGMEPPWKSLLDQAPLSVTLLAWCLARSLCRILQKKSSHEALSITCRLNVASWISDLTRYAGREKWRGRGKPESILLQLFIFMDCLDALHMVVGTIAIVSMLSQRLIFGNLIHSFGPTNWDHVDKSQRYMYIVL